MTALHTLPMPRLRGVSRLTMEKLNAVRPERWRFWQANKTPISAIVAAVGADYRPIGAFCEALGMQRWWRSYTQVRGERMDAILADVAGKQMSRPEICAKHDICDDTLRSLIRKSQRPVGQFAAKAAQRRYKHEGRANVEAVTPQQWDTWRRERWSHARIADEIGVARVTVLKFMTDMKWEWPIPVRCATGSKGRPRSRPGPAPAKRRDAAGPGWTWYDYAELCDREFATPHFLRQAPAMREWLERNGVTP